MRSLNAIANKKLQHQNAFNLLTVMLLFSYNIASARPSSQALLLTSSRSFARCTTLRCCGYFSARNGAIVAIICFIVVLRHSLAVVFVVRINLNTQVFNIIQTFLNVCIYKFNVVAVYLL